VDFKNDRDFLEAVQNREIFGQVKGFYSEKFQTQMYMTSTATPNHKGEIPLVDPKSKAVFIFAHGSGTMKSSGRNFIVNMNTLANLGFSALSIDMPFHAKGPRTEEFNKVGYFMEWVRSIVLEAKKAGVPVVLAGHSFGPDVILEYVTRYPKDVDGVVALSPAGFTKELDWYQANVTEKMNFGGEVAENVEGSTWAGTMGPQMLWNKKKLADPTVVNPNLKVRILTGMREEYFPAPLDPTTGLPAGDNTVDVSIPLKEMLKNSVVTREPGIGHYLFDHIDQNGDHAVTRELLAVLGHNPQQIKSMIEEVRAAAENVLPTERILMKYVQDSLFRAWADANYGVGKIPKISAQHSDGLATKIINEYRFALKGREEEIFQRILSTKTTHPEFYVKYQKIIDAHKPNKVDMTLFPQYFFEVLAVAAGQN
jgi:pimeloyl-ACP methyl ester carboxylesterase